MSSLIVAKAVMPQKVALLILSRGVPCNWLLGQADKHTCRLLPTCATQGKKACTRPISLVIEQPEWHKHGLDYKYHAQQSTAQHGNVQPSPAQSSISICRPCPQPKVCYCASHPAVAITVLGRDTDSKPALLMCGLSVDQHAVTWAVWLSNALCNLTQPRSRLLLLVTLSSM